MELYRKKVTKPNTGLDERYEEPIYNPSQRPKNIYMQKMIKKNRDQYTNENEVSNEGKNIQNVRSSMEDILSDENNKKKGIKYVTKKNRDIQSPGIKQVPRRIEKSVSPRGRGGYDMDYGEDSRDETPIRKVLNLSREPYFSAVGKRFNTISTDNKPSIRTRNNMRNINRKNYRNTSNDGDDEDYYDNLQKSQNYINHDENQNNFELSSLNDDERNPRGMKISRSPEPVRVNNKFRKVLRKPRYPEMRSKDIQAMYGVRKPNTTYLNTDINQNEDEDVDQLIRTIEDLQAIINGQKHEIRKVKKDNYNKDKEINLLRNELDEMQKELDDKRIEHDQEIDDIFRNNDNIPKLKNEYYKLLQDYDNNINDFNNLKDDYKKMVNE